MAGNDSFHEFAAALAALFLVASSPAQGAPLRHIWSAGFGDGYNQNLGSVALHPDGGVVAVGSFGGTVDFGGGPLVTDPASLDMFLVRFGPDGSHIWSRRFAQDPPATLSWVHAAATDGEGNIIVAGELAGILDLGGGPLFPSGMRSAFVAKFDPGGAHVWSAQFGASAVVRGLATDGEGNIAVAGDAIGSIDFGGGELAGQGGSDAFVATLGPDGSHRWSRRIGPSDHQYVRDVAMDRNGGVALAGVFSGLINAGGTLMTGAGSTDGWLARYDAAGAHQWSRRFGDTQDDECNGVAIDSLAGVVVGGSFRGRIDTGGGFLTIAAPARDGFILAFDAAGAHRWSEQLHATLSARVNAVDTDASGNTFMAGEFHGDVMLGRGTYLGPENFLAALDPDGVVMRVKLIRFGGWNLAIDGGVAGRVAFGATNYSVMNLGGSDIVTAGYADVLVAEFWSGEVPPAPIISFSAAVEASAVVIRWVVRDDLVTHFVLERWTGDAGDRRVVASGRIGSHNGWYQDGDMLSLETYTYELTVSGGGEDFHSPPASVTVPAVATSLRQNAPNPFTTETGIEYRLERPADVVIGIYDVTGARVRLLDEGSRGAGIHRVTWDGRDQAGRPLASGVYFCRVENLPGVPPRKMVRVR